MSTRYDRAKKILVDSKLPFGLWALLNLTLCIGFGANLGLEAALFFLVLFFGFSSLVIYTFDFHLFPALMANDHIKVLKFSIISVLLYLSAMFYQLYIPDALDLRVPDDLPILGRLLFWTIFTSGGMVLVASIHMTQHYYKNRITELSLEADKTKAELDILKNQINPHFLFNTLNNIYGLAYLGDQKAALMISRLSQVMRYLLYDCDQPDVQLIKEKELIENYLDLQSLKHDFSVNVDFYEEGVEETTMIPPMILINFVENCFKHSDVDTNPSAWIKISLEQDNDKLIFTTQNTMKQNIEKVLFDRKGIGLNNSKKLLAAHYPQRHTLEIAEENNVYEVALNIDL